MNKQYARVICAIPKGKDNAIHTEELARQFGVSMHIIKKYVQEARDCGIPISSDKNGYWLTNDRAELQKFVDTMEKQGKKRLKTVRALKDTLKKTEGQKSLFNALQDKILMEEKE